MPATAHSTRQRKAKKERKIRLMRTKRLINAAFKLWEIKQRGRDGQHYV